MGIISSNKVELRVDLGKTSLEDLQKFNQTASEKGGGEVRALKNKDGSFTLYVPADNKVRLRKYDIFGGENWKANERNEKRDLAKNIVKDILSRRLPGNEDHAIIQNMAGNGNHNLLAPLLPETASSVYQAMSHESINHYQDLNTVLGSPELSGALRTQLELAYAEENLDFLLLEKSFSKAKSPQEKLAVAEQIMELIGTANNPGALHLDDNIANTIRQEMTYLRLTIVTGQQPAPGDLARLNNLFTAARGAVFNDINNSNHFTTFKDSDQFKEIAGSLFGRAGMTLPDRNQASILRNGSGHEFLSKKEVFVRNNPNHPNPDKAVAELMFNEQMGIIPGAQPGERGWDRFEGVELQGSGGATGSGQAKVGRQLFQVKGSIEHAGLGRRIKAGGLNTENYGEVIASNISRALVGNNNQEQIPVVVLRQNTSKYEAMVTSEYLKGGKGDLKALYMELAGPLPQGQRHPKIELDSPGLSSGGVLRLDGISSRDVQRNIALSALMGDHDVNPGNMIALNNGHIGRIDFGHAFNELINGIGGSLFGGGVKFPTNRILDFFNRESISGLPGTGQQTPKLWRDYIGAGPSDGMTAALREIASSQTHGAGLTQAREQFVELITPLVNDTSREATQQVQDLTNSLKAISQNIGMPVIATDPVTVANEVFDNIETFITDGQQQMATVADLSDLQVQIDTFISNTLNDPNANIPAGITNAYQALLNSTVAMEGNNGLIWMKTSRDTPAFKGDLASFIQMRRG